MKRKAPSVLMYDERWIAFCFCDEACVRREAAGGAMEIPEEILEFLRESESRRVRVLLSGEIHRLETSMPAKLTFDEVNTLLVNEIAELSATDDSGLLCAGSGGEVFGACGRFMLAGCFERTQVEHLHRQLGAEGFVFDGVGSLELACLAHWNVISDVGTETLLLFGSESSFVFPSAALRGAPGALTVSGGTRQAVRDAETWQLRFQRSTRFLEKAESGSALVLGTSPEAMRALLESAGGLPTLTFLDTDSVLENAARIAAGVRVNSLKATVPLANPYIPRKRFHHAYLIAPWLLILLAPGFYSLFVNVRYSRQMQGFRKEAVQFAPLEKEIKEATKKKERAQIRVDRMLAEQQFLADRRKPMFALIHMAYFFSKHAGTTVRIESITDQGSEIQVKGVYTDPEDGLALNQELEAFLTDKGLRLIYNKMAEEGDEEGFIVLHLDLRVDYSKLVK